MGGGRRPASTSVMRFRFKSPEEECFVLVENEGGWLASVVFDGVGTCDVAVVGGSGV